MNNGYNVRDDYKTLSVEGLKEIQTAESLPFSVMMLNLTGDLNIGMIIRSAALLGAEDVYIFGRRKIDRRSLVGVQNYVNIHKVWGLDGSEEVDFDFFMKYCSEKELNPVLIEHGGIRLDKVDWESDGRYWKPCFVFGSESNGFPEEFINSNLPKVSIPQRGVMRSFNVASAASMVMWDYVSNKFSHKLGDV